MVFISLIKAAVSFMKVLVAMVPNRPLCKSPINPCGVPLDSRPANCDYGVIVISLHPLNRHPAPQIVAVPRHPVFRDVTGKSCLCHGSGLRNCENQFKFCNYCTIWPWIFPQSISPTPNNYSMCTLNKLNKFVVKEHLQFSQGIY